MSDESLSFHCIVCYENFDTSTRYPVVLTCGHTYICHECALRLDKCMECRTDLFAPAKENVHSMALARNQVTGRSSATGWGRRGGQAPPKPRPVKPQRDRLPLPKNLVLLSLMEATIRASPIGHCELSASDERDRIVAGVSLAAGICGTYVVTCKEGLDIYPIPERSVEIETLPPPPPPPPEIKSKKKTKSPKATSRILTPIRRRNLTRPRPNHTPPKEVEKPAPSPPSTPSPFSFYENFMTMKLSDIRDNAEEMLCSSPKNKNQGRIRASHRDRIQVVDINAQGIAKLGRGMGLIFLEKGTELVKVGGPEDKACQIEGIIMSLVARMAEVHNDYSNLQHTLVSLKKDFENALCNDGSPVICRESNVISRIDDENDENVRRSSSKAKNSEQNPTNSRNPDTFQVQSSSSFPNYSINGTPQRKSNIRKEVVVEKPIPANQTTDYRTGFSNHRGLNKPQNIPISYNRRPMMSTHSGLNMSRKLWSKESVMESFSFFPGLSRTNRSDNCARASTDIPLPISVPKPKRTPE